MKDKLTEDTINYATIHVPYFHAQLAGMRVALKIENQILDIKMTKEQEDEIVIQQMAERFTRHA